MPGSETQYLRDSGLVRVMEKWAFIVGPSVLEGVSCDSTGEGT